MQNSIKLKIDVDAHSLEALEKQLKQVKKLLKEIEVQMEDITTSIKVEND